MPGSLGDRLDGLTPQQTLALGITQFVVLLFSLSFHESAHAWTALRQGDSTARALGRISLNPLVHVDLIGTVVLPLVMIFTGAPLLGWAKPTPVNPRFFKSLRWGQIVVSAAGPVSNMLLVLVFTAALFVASRLFPHPALVVLLKLGIQLNVLLAIFNLLPVPPLDGSHVVEWALPNGLGHRYMAAIAPYGGLLLLALVMTGTFSTLLGPLYRLVVGTLVSLAR